MKHFTLFTLLIFALSFSSCKKDQAVLEDLAGEWNIVEVSIALSDGGTLNSDALIGTSINLNPCDSEDNNSSERCDLQVNNPNDGMELFLKYNVVRSPGVGEQVLQISEGDVDHSAVSTTLLYDLMTRIFLQDVSGNQLTLTSNRTTTGVGLMSQDVEEIVITARRP